MIRATLLCGLVAAPSLVTALDGTQATRSLSWYSYKRYPKPPAPPPGPTCGNGIVETREECDDGNTDSGDGCDSNCKIEDVIDTCGNGIIDDGEECEPPSRAGCNASCQIVECPVCPDCPPLPTCGDGNVDAGETCDDGNDDDDDDCRNDCTSCGDGIVNGGEECDGGPSCNPDCTIKAPPPPPPSCGDGTVNGDETCDPPGDDGCRDDCTFCGDGIVNGGEECDGGDSCNPDCTTPAPPPPVPECGDRIISGDETCEPPNRAGCRADCTFCGDEIVNGDEDCDDGPDGSETCTPDCETPPTQVCGDGIVQEDETCDDGNDVDTDGCRNDCTFCGDGIVNGGEECDEGPTGNVRGGTCRPDCTTPPEQCGFCKPRDKSQEIGKPVSVTLGWACDGPPPASISDNSNGSYDPATGIYEVGPGFSKDLEIDYAGTTETLHLSCSAPLGRFVRLQSPGQSKKCQGGCGDEPECTGCFQILEAISEEGLPYCDLDCSQVGK